MADRREADKRHVSPALRPYQRRALDAIETAEADGARRAWVVLPSEPVKTVVGIQTARRRGGAALVLVPNAAIQAQWLSAWERLVGSPAGCVAHPETALTVLTYDSWADVDSDPGDHGPLGHHVPQRRHDGAPLVRLRGVKGLTVVLDDHDHVVEGREHLLTDLLELLPDAFVVGLTSTSEDHPSGRQRSMFQTLFGGAVFECGIPALVREGDLAPFAELAWLTPPTRKEAAWLASQAAQFRELTKALGDRGFGSTDFFTWLDDQPPPGDTARRDALLRMVHAGLASSRGTRLAERHRCPPTARDWVVLLDGWLTYLAGTGLDADVVARVSQALPVVGYRLTRQGIRRGRSPVDRLLMRSEAKTIAVGRIVQAERRTLGARTRMLVVCDPERETDALPVQLAGVLDQQAGSATSVLHHLLETVPDVNPLLVTETTLTGSPETLRALTDYVDDPALTAHWTSREWVPWVTRFFEDGHTLLLVSTPGLLARGWDTGTVTGVVDLTTAASGAESATIRDPALRTDPGWRHKVALIWSVVCVAEGHPEGGEDWDRFVTKQAAIYGANTDGEIVAGVARVDVAFSPFVPPGPETVDAVNARMLARGERREAVRADWAVGTPYADELLHTVRVRRRREDDSKPGPVPAVLQHGRVVARDGRPSPWKPHTVVALGLVVALLVFLLNLTPGVLVAIFLATLLGLQTTVAVDRGRVLAEDLARRPGVLQIASAVADALREAGLSPVGHEAVRVSSDSQEATCWLHAVPPEVSARFAAAVDEVMSPMASPRYVVPRWVLTSSVDNAEGLQAALGRLRPEAQVWHPVPAVLSTDEVQARAFAHAWDHWVGGGAALSTHSPAGEKVLLTHRGSDPFVATTSRSARWR